MQREYLKDKLYWENYEMKKGRKFIMNPWTVAIGSGIILTILTDIFKKETIFSTLKFLITGM